MLRELPGDVPGFIYGMRFKGLRYRGERLGV